jgi:transcriptional regulator with XRE-family HTH domain
MEPTEGRRIELEDFDKSTKAGGAGASGEVWKARPKRDLPFAATGQDVALKIYKEDILKEPDQRQRIAEEYKTGFRLAHPNLVKIFHVDIEKDPPFMIMEWCEGSTLFDWRAMIERPDEEFLLQFATEMLDALEFLHSTRRLHRDVKPTNIHIDNKGKIRLLDYGIIRSLREPAITKSDARFVGTYRYSAPEYILEDRYTYASDLYSFGAVLYYLLHGREIFATAKRTPDIITAKQLHNLSFDDKIQSYGPISAGLFELSKRLLTRDPSQRPPSALACLDILDAAVPSEIPLRVYFACALTRGNEESKARAERVGEIVRKSGRENDFSVYFPGEHTHPLGAPDLAAAEVYWIDRERVASSDFLVIYADEPSFGVGQEAEIAANAGVPIAIFSSKGVNVSRMLKGIAGRVTEVTFKGEEQLATEAGIFFKGNKARLRLSRRTREREYNLRLGNRVREGRESADLTTNELAEQAGLSKELIESLESRPEQQSAISVLNLRRIARALKVSPAELLRDQGVKDQQFEDILRESTTNLRSFALRNQLAYEVYAELKRRGREVIKSQVYGLAARGNNTVCLRDEDWENIYDEWRHEKDQGKARAD